ncbi:MAG: hypothetical protein QGG75_00255 [Alphaproteobacteria bacterium]|jgi:hypothetical protein|nr:hypothetical protein [Alphaproteobacteria bacterium]
MEAFEPELRQRLIKAHPGLSESDVDKIEAMLSDRQDVDRLLDAKTARKMDAERKAFVAEKMPKLRQVMMAFDRQQQQKRAPRKPAKIRIKERPRAR